MHKDELHSIAICGMYNRGMVTTPEALQRMLLPPHRNMQHDERCQNTCQTNADADINGEGFKIIERQYTVSHVLLDISPTVDYISSALDQFDVS